MFEYKKTGLNIIQLGSEVEKTIANSLKSKSFLLAVANSLKSKSFLLAGKSKVKV